MKIEKKLPQGVRKHIRKQKRNLRKSGVVGSDRVTRVAEIYTTFKKRFIKTK